MGGPTSNSSARICSRSSEGEGSTRSVRNSNAATLYQAGRVLTRHGVSRCCRLSALSVVGCFGGTTLLGGTCWMGLGGQVVPSERRPSLSGPSRFTHLHPKQLASHVALLKLNSDALGLAPIVKRPRHSAPCRRSHRSIVRPDPPSQPSACHRAAASAWLFESDRGARSSGRRAQTHQGRSRCVVEPSLRRARHRLTPKWVHPWVHQRQVSLSL